MGKAIFVCVAENEHMGRTYYPGEWYEGPLEDSPVDKVGWAQREPLPSEAAPNEGSGLSGKNTEAEWRPAREAVTVAPVVVGFDLLHGEEIVDQEATRMKQLEVDMVRRGLWPQPTKEEHWQRHLSYLREHVPEMYQEWVRTHPDDALGGAPAGVQETLAQPVEEVVQVKQSENQEQDLDELLEAEVRVEKAGDSDKLTAIRARIEEAMQ
jgi:hypothetical protein